MNEYTEMQSVRIPNGIVGIGPPSFTLIDGKQSWLTEWHPYFGPSHLNKDGSVMDKQPGERSRFWLIAQWWFNQGAVVVDGVGQWKEPPREKRFIRMVGKRRFVEHGPGEGIEEVDGDYIHDWSEEPQP